MKIKIINASAGSGKTHRLTIEYLEILYRTFGSLNKNKIDYHKMLSSILAITFTNKAAGEMQDRIINYLKSFSIKKKSDLNTKERNVLDELVARGLSESFIISSSGTLIDIILSYFNDFNVKTIDSLMGQMIKVLSPDFQEFDPNFDIDIDLDIELKQKTKQFLSEIADRNWLLLEQLLISLEKTEGLMNWNVEFSFINIINSLFNKYLITKDLSFRDYKYDYFVELDEEIKIKIDILKDKLSILLKLLDENILTDDINKTILNKNLISKLKRVYDNGTLNEIENLTSYSFFKKDKVEELFKKNHRRENIEKFKKVYSPLKETFCEIIILLSRKKTLYQTLLFSDFIEFLNNNRKTFYVKEFSRKILDKLDLWGNEFSYLYLKLSERFNHYLIDEFQDTSEIQFASLSPLIYEELTSNEENSSLLCIGDNKQAIYRWRGGVSELIKDKYLLKALDPDKVLKDSVESIILKNNWRSCREIIMFNNSFWSADNLMSGFNSDKLKRAIETNFSNVTQEISDSREIIDGYVEMDITSYTDIDNENDYIFNNIYNFISKCIKSGYDLNDIAILTRSKKEIREIISYLTKKEIDCISSEALYLKSSKIINEIISFMRFLDYPPDNLSFYTFVKSDLFQKEVCKKHHHILSKLRDEIFIQNNCIYYKTFQKEFKEIWLEYIYPFYISTGYLKPYDLYQDITQKFQIFENFPESVVYLLAFGEILHNLEQKEMNSISSFISQWDNLIKENKNFSIEMPENLNNVKVLTLHSSKGLEFPIVIIPCYSKPDRNNENIYFSNNEIYYIKKEYAYSCKYLKKIYEKEMILNYIDELNLLYVGMTRPEKILYMPVMYKINKKKDSVSTKFKNFSEVVVNNPFINFDIKSAGNIIKSFGNMTTKKISINKKKIKNQVIKINVSSKNIETAKWKKEFLKFTSSKFQETILKRKSERGVKLHKFLSKLELFHSGEELKKKIHELSFNSGLDSGEIDLIVNYIMRDDVIGYFTGNWNVLNEIEIVDIKRKKRIRIDRLLINDDCFFVIDYKTGHENLSENKDQIKHYIQVVKDIYTKKNGRGYLLYLDINSIEEINAKNC